MINFTVFPRLPVELQDAIWALSLAEPEPEVCIVWPLDLEAPEDQPTLPFIVDTAWPSIAHVCRAARAVALSSPLVRLRYSASAGFLVPYRAFDPSIDCLYWGVSQVNAMEFFFKKTENAALARSLRHIAIELPAMYPPSVMAEMIRESAIFVRTLSFVLPETSDTCSARTEFAPPARRCRLRDIPEGTIKEITLEDVPFLPPHRKRRQGLLEWLHARRGDMDDHVRKFNVTGDEGSAWSTPDQRFGGLEIKIQSFVEWESGQWVEVCGQRKLGLDGQAPRLYHIRGEDRRNPAEYRVLDDDCGIFCSSTKE
ncbi:hypothetical protein B0I35DRAFT_150781 [Stachybotrys elegans]|uniref:2EXR domain-containing protein n=1 Tax=Stachybotrys elegans TaxID=80388 RepID=A0A8K0SI56_9HYPO|nr:hypothetical protein B0I35DRAFT_150781 [Stachybotrys elegans]